MFANEGILPSKFCSAASALSALLAAASYNLASIKITYSSLPETTLRSVERQIASLPFEVCVVLGPNGREVLRVKGDEKTVKFNTQQQALMRDGYATHNHPNGSEFSIQDIYMAHVLDLREIRAVAYGAPALVHVLSRPTGGWQVQRCVALFKAELQRLRTKYGVSQCSTQEERDQAEQQARDDLDLYYPLLVKELDLHPRTFML